MSNPKPATSALSITALVVGSLSSAASAVVVHEFWKAGAILGAALTPVLVALFSELLRRPVDRFEVRTLTGPRLVRVAGAADSPAPVRVYRARPRWGLALATGAAAFVVGVAALTATELVLDRSVGDGRERTTLFDRGRSSPPLPSTAAPAPLTTEPRSDGAERGQRTRTTPPRVRHAQTRTPARPGARSGDGVPTDDRSSPAPPAPSTTASPAPPTSTHPQEPVTTQPAPSDAWSVDSGQSGP